MNAQTFTRIRWLDGRYQSVGCPTDSAKAPVPVDTDKRRTAYRTVAGVLTERGVARPVARGCLVNTPAFSGSNLR
jgi:hypothetical protein